MAAAGVNSAVVARELAIKVFRDRLMQSGHVDLPSCLSCNTTTSRNSSNDGTRDPQRIQRVMVGLCRQVRKDYETLFEDMIDQLQPTPQTSYGQFLGFASELFKDGVTHGKIVSLYVFCAEVANYCMFHSRSLGPRFVASILEWHSRCFNDVAKTWLDAHGGWVSKKNCLLFTAEFVSANM